MESSPGGGTETKLNSPSSLPSPNISSSSSSSASIPATGSDPNKTNNNNPNPTTFVRADATSFKQVVQMLTGSSETVKQAQRTNPIPPLKSAARNHHHQQQGFKLYERRNSVTNGFKISPLSSGIRSNPYGLPPRKPEMILSPSMLDFPSLVLSPVTPLMTDPFNKAPNSSSVGSGLGAGLDVKAEEEAIAAKGFFLHSSSPRESEPMLLPLFPMTSAKQSGSSSS
uniref:VQ domain-containing protein n=1 Tax=Kalanchoe fedtschenkoi TaxID=63787 RepID=A0A7N0RDZ2_KALFE